METATVFNWKTLKGDSLPQDIISVVRSTIVSEIAQGHKLKVCIGTDSQVRGHEVCFASVICFIREKKGGFMYVSKEKQVNYMSLKERMIMEVSRSIEVAYKLCGTLDDFGVELEVHADINTDPNFESNVALKEAMGYILSMGFEFKAKPDAFASSSCADKFVQ